MSTRYFDEYGKLGTISRTGHHILMVGYELQPGDWLESLAPLDAPEYLPAGGSYWLDAGHGVTPFAAGVLTHRPF